MSTVTDERIPPLTLGWRLKMALGDMKRSEMATTLGVDPATISRWCSDRGTPPRAVYLKMWALATGVNHSWLATGSVDGDDGPPGGERPGNPGDPVTRW